MTTTVRAGRVHDALDLRVEDIPAPPLLPGHVALQPKFCGLCGSDLHIYFEPEMAAPLKLPHALTGASLPLCFGHEFAGVLTELEAVYAGDLSVGDRVVVMPTLTDGTCWACTNGHANTCSQIGFVGINGATGGLSDRAVVPAELVFKLPESIGCDVGALIEPVAVAWHAVYKPSPPITSSTSVLILGVGPVGCAVLLCLLSRGVKTIVVSEPSPTKRAFALKLGASAALHPSEVPTAIITLLQSTSKQFDVVFDCAGIPGVTVDTAVQSVRSQGTIVVLAIQTAATVPLLDMIRKEVQMKCSLAYTRQDFVEVIRAVEEGRLDPRPLITKKIRLEDVVSEGLVPMHKGNGKECKILVDLEMK